ncbi:unnamed protein product [Spirodela intermedia]|uniref:Uncharacterized protein n=1 Tax=Spirodela intermedia TaxID=51605 RepID=A0A7I8IIR2_SPIIN|nr:unnamed protein product [Spirodela intermedia]CAA6657765.1 unnamed protein product [Spirodela intermedia]
MGKPMEKLQDLIEEAKVRTVGWGICIFGIAYFLSHTSKSMWTNIPIAILIFSAFRYLSYEVEVRWKIRPTYRPTYLSHLEKRQLPINDPRLSTSPSVPRLKRKINSPPIEAAISGFIDKILQDFVIDLWYSSITPDKDAPELIRLLLLDVLGEISGRIKEINLVDLLTRDMVELIGNHLDLYRRNQSEIGVDIMGTLSFVERDEKLKQHLIVLQRLVGGVLASVLRPQEAQCPLARCFSREFLTCLVMQPIMNFASPGFINELIEQLFLIPKEDKNEDIHGDKPPSAFTEVHGTTVNCEPAMRGNETSNHSKNTLLVKTAELPLSVSEKSRAISSHVNSEYPPPQSADWARVLDAATQRRTQILAPENLENMWTRGRNYKKKTADLVKAVASPGSKNVGRTDERPTVRLHDLRSNPQQSGDIVLAQNFRREPSKIDESHSSNGPKNDVKQHAKSNKDHLKRSSSASALVDRPYSGTKFMSEDNEAMLSRELHTEQFGRHPEELSVKSASDLHSHSETSLLVPKLRCRVIGACFEKISSKSFAVYSIAVADAENQIWIVKRRYRNFERLHRHLKDIPNYALHLPPKRFLSSSIDDSFVHQRCILLDKYLQDLLSVPNVAEQHEVWDFFSVSSKNYSFGKSTSVMKTLAVNVDDAMDDIVRQFKGVSDGILRKVSGSPSPSLTHTVSPQKAETSLALPWNDDVNKPSSSDRNLESYRSSNLDMSNSMSDDEIQDEEVSTASINGWHSDNELNTKAFPPRVVKWSEESESFNSQRDQQSGKPDRLGLAEYLAANSSVLSDPLEAQNSAPPEWTPPNVSVPLLNLVDKIFQLNRRGWLRRQVFWISKQILQLMMEDAFDDWLLRQIHWLRQDDIIAQGIDWIKNALWPNGTFFMKMESSLGKMDDIHANQVSPSTGPGSKGQKPSSFELQLEAARRASDIKKMFLDGAPTALVSLIGYKQYRRCAKDVYYFLQSTVCVKQLAYGMLELLIVSIFPELRNLVEGMHQRKHIQTEM